jgi:hypothetical protein
MAALAGLAGDGSDGALDSWDGVQPHIRAAVILKKMGSEPGAGSHESSKSMRRGLASLLHDAALDFVTKVLDLAFYQVLRAYGPAKDPIVSNPKTVRPTCVNWAASKRPHEAVSKKSA